MKLIIDLDERKWQSVKDGTWCGSEEITQGTPLTLCKDCKYFEYDSVANVDGIPLIVAHEICKRWGTGCKTREDGFCFLAERMDDTDTNVGNMEG